MADAPRDPEPPPGFAPALADAILQGAVDLHVHPAPSPDARRLGVFSAARAAARAGYRAIVVKSHHHSMVTDVLALREVGLDDLGVAVHAGIALNAWVGGVNPYAVELSLALGGRIIWFPTYSSHAHLAHESEKPHVGPLRTPPEVAVLDADGRLLPEVLEVLDLAAARGAIVTGGHLAAPVIDVLFAEARRRGVERLVVNHPQYVVDATLDKVAEWARAGVLIEHSVGMYHDSFGHKTQRWPLGDLLAYLAAAGPGQSALVSDTGQAGNLAPVDTMRLIVDRLLGEGLSAEQLRALTGDNAARVLLA